MISRRIQQLTPSPTLALDAQVKNMQANGIAVTNLCLGEPDFNTPEHIENAAYEAMKAGFTHYTNTAGIPKLREVISEKFKKDNNILYDPSQIIVGMGSKPLLYITFQSILNPNDEVIIPTPTWNTFVEQVKLSNGKPVLLPLKPPFRLTARDIEKKLTKKTKMLLINTPSNPTGMMIEKKELEQIASLAVKHNIYIIADEIYEKLTYGEKHISLASLSKQVKERTITINGFSKAYAMTGWRIGYAGGPKEIIQAMVSLQGQLTSNAVSFIQKAGIEALTGNQKPLKNMVAEFEKRRKFIIESFSNMHQLSFSEPDGAFYLFVSVEKLLGKRYKSSSDWCNALLKEQNVAVVPGEGFFYPGYFRLSYAASMEELKKGVEGIKEFLI